MAKCASCGATKLTEQECPRCGRLPNVPIKKSK